MVLDVTIRPVDASLKMMWFENGSYTVMVVRTPRLLLEAWPHVVISLGRQLGVVFGQDPSSRY